MAVYAEDRLGTVILEALGIDPSTVIEFTLSCSHRGTELVARHFAEIASNGDLVDIVKTYRVVEITEEG